MLYNLLLPYVNSSHIANLFKYISFRSTLALLLSLAFCFIFAPRIIRKLGKLQKNGQPIRGDGPETHAKKIGTPTMGGIIIISGVTISTLLLTDLRNHYIWVILFVFIAYGILGFVDDYLKLTKNNSKGISAKGKMFFQIVVALLACGAVQRYSPDNYASHLAFPFFKNLLLDLGWLYLPFAVCVVIGSSNAVNLTDGLDGLATVPIILATGCFGIITYLVGNTVFSNYLQIIYVPQVEEVVIICAAVIGSSLGFLWYNAQPAEIFMGDTGSLSLGGLLGVISVITKHELVLAIVGGLFVIETLSVIIQVYYYRISGGKRVFLMAPLHHHFEKLGWSESKVVVRFWIIAVIFSLLGLATLKLR